MPHVVSKHDGAHIHYRDYRPSRATPFQPHADRNNVGKPTLVFTAAWPFSSQMYDQLMLPLCESHGYRCIAVDRRGFGHSDWAGPKGAEIDYDTFADDLAQVLAIVEIGESFVGIGASLGCGELLLMLSRHPEMQALCRGLVFLGPSLPIPMQTERKAAGPPRAFWDNLLQELREERVTRLATALSYIWGEVGTKLLSVTENARYERMAWEADPFALERTVQIFLARDFTDFIQEKGRTFDFPILILHGNADAANPVESGPGFIRDNTRQTNVIIYEDAAHGIAATHKERCLQDIATFLQDVCSSSK